MGHSRRAGVPATLDSLLRVERDTLARRAASGATLADFALRGEDGLS
jgi:hypothetical protein